MQVFCAFLFVLFRLLRNSQTIEINNEMELKKQKMKGFFCNAAREILLGFSSIHTNSKSGRNSNMELNALVLSHTVSLSIAEVYWNNMISDMLYTVTPTE